MILCWLMLRRPPRSTRTDPPFPYTTLFRSIRVNALAPGYVETNLNRDFFASEQGRALVKRIPQRRLGNPQDLDGALLLLASDASLYMTGSSIEIGRAHV